MMLSAARLEEITRLREGKLSELPYPQLVWSLASERRTAVLELRRRQVQKNVIFEWGVPVDCRSNLAHETFGRFLVTAGALAEEAFQGALNESLARGVPLGEILVERGLIGHYAIYRYLQQNLAHKLLDPFTWTEGEFRLSFDVPQVTSPLKVKVPQLLVTGILRFVPQPEVDFAAAPLIGRRLGIHPDPRVPLAEVRLSRAHAGAIELLREPRSLGELAQLAGLPFPETTRLIAALWLLGCVGPADELPAAAPVPPPAARKEAPAPAPPPAPGLSAPSGEEAERRREQLMAAYLNHRRLDPFDLLGVAPEAGQAEIEERFLAYAERYSPWSFTGPELEPIADRARELFVAGAAAFGQLMDAEQRNVLRARRTTLLQKSASSAPSFAIKTDLLDPEVQYRKGKALLEAGKWKLALQEIEFAADCDPQNGLYRAEAAWCRFMDSPATAARQALEDLDEAVRIDPKCGVAHLYAGEIHARLGNYDEAEDWLRRANKLMAPDRRAMDALREVAAKRKKR